MVGPFVRPGIVKNELAASSCRVPRPMLAVIALIIWAHSSAAGPPPGGRTPWTTSRFAGTPDPAPPYRVEPAFPRLTFDRPVLLDSCPGTTGSSSARSGARSSASRMIRRPTGPRLALDLARVRPGASALYGLAFHPKFAGESPGLLCYVARNDTPDGTARLPVQVDGARPAADRPGQRGGPAHLPLGRPQRRLPRLRPRWIISTSPRATPPPRRPPDPLKTGQDISDLLSSILRIDVDRRDPGKTYRVPPDNPFVATPGARPEVWAYGLRNPWRMSFDRERGDLWVGDVGWELWEMIHLVRTGSNCGWAAVEGPQPVRST